MQYLANYIFFNKKCSLWLFSLSTFSFLMQFLHLLKRNILIMLKFRQQIIYSEYVFLNLIVCFFRKCRPRCFLRNHNRIICKIFLSSQKHRLRFHHLSNFKISQRFPSGMFPSRNSQIRRSKESPRVRSK